MERIRERRRWQLIKVVEMKGTVGLSNCTVNIKQQQLLLHQIKDLFSRTTWSSWYQKGKTSLDLNEARNLGTHVIYAKKLHLAAEPHGSEKSSSGLRKPDDTVLASAWASTPLEHWGSQVAGRRSSAEDARIEAPYAARGVESWEGLCPFPENL